MLNVIIGHTNIAIYREEATDKLQYNLTKIKDAAQRSAELTKQLLAFARRQTVVPKIIDINIAVNSILQMLRLLIGEDIDLLWIPAAGTNQVKIDPSQFDQIMVNLTVNARDAISGIGKITIETQRVFFDENWNFSHSYFTPGDYAVLILSDNGSGMDEKTKSKIFDSFSRQRVLVRERDWDYQQCTVSSSKTMASSMSIVNSDREQHLKYIYLYMPV